MINPKSIILCLALFLASSCHCNAQFEIEPTDSIKLENLSRGKIRRILLDLNPENEVHYYALKSRKNSNWSAVWYSLGGMFIFTGVAFIAEVGDEPSNAGSGVGEAAGNVGVRIVAVSYFTLGGLSIIHGTTRTKLARSNLDYAIAQFEKK